MSFFKIVPVLKKPWHLLRKYILTIPRFDLFLQGALLIVILLETNVYLLLRRNAGTGYLPAPIEDWVMMGVGGIEFLVGALVAWTGRTRRHFMLATWLGLTSVAALAVLFFPYPESSPPTVALCGGETISAYSAHNTTAIAASTEVEDEQQTVRTIVLIITAVLCSLTQVSVWAHGITYLDDHEPQNGPYFYGILISIRLSLGLSGQSWLRAGSVREDWWEAHISLAMLTFMFAILFTLFPKRMSQYKEIEDNVAPGFLSSLGRVLGNKALVMQTGALALLNAALFGFVHHDDAFIQARYQVESIRQDPRTSNFVNDIFRSLVIIFFVTVFRVRFSMRRPDGVKANTASKVGGVTAVFVAAFFSVLTGIGCSSRDIAGMTDEYTQPSCSLGCGCQSENYGFSPVCALDTDITYFSPCHAGCNEYEEFNGFLLFSNCTCNSARAIRGSCTLSACSTIFSIYLLFFTLVLALTAASLVMQGMVVLRSVLRVDKPLAVGVSMAAVALFAHVFGHALYLLITCYSIHLPSCVVSSMRDDDNREYVIDYTCSYWGDEVCLYHSPTIWTIGLASAVLALLSAVVSIVASRMYVNKNIVITQPTHNNFS